MFFNDFEVSMGQRKSVRSRGWLIIELKKSYFGFCSNYFNASTDLPAEWSGGWWNFLSALKCQLPGAAS